MNHKKNISGITKHILHKKNGILATPLNDAFSDTLKLSSWAKERIPEYLWLGLILMRYGRKDGLERAGRIFLELAREIKLLSLPRLSMIFGLSSADQRKACKIICRYADKNVLAPLTVIYKSRFYPIFNEYFFVSDYSIEKRIDILSKAILLYSPHQSNEASDLRFLVISYLGFKEKLMISTEMNPAITALKEYAYTDHEDEKMRLYRPTVRSIEGAMHFDEYDAEFSSKFWRNIGMITPCKPIKIEFPEEKNDHKEFTTDCRKVLEYVFYSNKEKSLTEDRFDVIVGSTNYALKIFTELNDKALGNSILGRHGIRTIIEVYVMLKYMLKREVEQPRIWEEYKLYGVSKYKLVLLKARESNFLDTTSHFVLPVAEALVNEIKWEEFIDVDLNYFDKQGIRDKSIEAGEKELYDLFYDYDSSFSHGLWGAIRESAMLHCDSADHQYHTVPDIYDNQNLPDVKSDSIKIMKMLFALLSQLYDIPAWFTDKYNLTK